MELKIENKYLYDLQYKEFFKYDSRSDKFIVSKTPERFREATDKEIEEHKLTSEK